MSACLWCAFACESCLINEIAVIVCPGDQSAYATAAGPLARQMRFIPQTEALGYGHAVHCAAEFTGDDPFLLTVGDHLYTSRTDKSCTAQLLETAEAGKCCPACNGLGRPLWPNSPGCEWCPCA